MARALLVAAALVAAVACVQAQELLAPGPGAGLPPTENQDFRFGPAMPRVSFVGKRALVRVHPNATTPAHALLKFGGVFEVDRFGRRVDVHSVRSLAALAPTLTYGARTAGAASYTWVKLRYGMAQLGLNTTAYACAVAAQGSIAMEAASRAQLAQAAQRQQLEAMAAAGAVVGGAGTGGGGGGVPVGAASGGLPGYTLPPGYAALQQQQQPGRVGGLPGAAAGFPGMPAAMGAPVSYLPRSPVYATAPINVYGRRRLQQMYAYAPAPSSSRPTYANWGPAPQQQQQLPAGYGGAVGVPAATSALGSAGASSGSATYDPTAEGYLTLTFYTGFANATAFPYGKGNAITAPGGGLKWSLEAANWPFCSFDHTLALELDVSTTKSGTAMGQWTVGSEDAAPLARAQAAQAAGRGPASVMVNDAFAPPPAKRRRDLKQAGLGAYLSYMDEEDAAALAGKRAGGAGGRAGGRAGVAGPSYGTVRVAKLLMNDTGAVELGFPTYAFESPIGARAVNVSILLDSALAPAATAGGGKAASAPARFTFGLPYFQTIYYDPTVSFGDNEGMPISDLAQLPAGCTDVSCLGGAAAAPLRVAKRGQAGDAKNGAGGGGGRGGGGAAAAAAAALLAAWVVAM